mgnify:CR=1 FL=1
MTEENLNHSLNVQQLTKSFPTASEPLPVLTGVSLSLSESESVAIVGPSGSGKSTLLQILGTLDRPDGGEVRIDQTNPFALHEDELAAFRNQHIGFIFQDHHLLPQLTVIENVLVPTLAGGRPGADDFARARGLLESVGLADRLGHLPGELSGGERERVAIARALLMGPSLILADEPTGNLDHKSGQDVIRILEELNERGITLIVVTHDAEMGQRAQRLSLIHI